MITEKQLRTINMIKKYTNKKFIGDLNNSQQVNYFISTYLPLIKRKINSLTKYNKRERYIIKNYSKW